MRLREHPAYLSASQLGITEHQRASLLAVAIMLREGSIPEEQFDMDLWFDRGATNIGCGSVGCVGGWCDTLFNTRFAGAPKPFGLYKLFYDYWAVSMTPSRKDTAQEIERYLQTGEAW